MLGPEWAMSAEPIKSWREFFESHAAHYDQNVFTRNTRVEVQFLLDLMDLPRGSSILDMGCGTGRHSVELARQGFLVTGVDRSMAMLAQARAKARAAGVEVCWVEADATAFVADKAHDAAICLCEGAFGLVEHDEDPLTHDMAILRNVAASLKPGAPFVLTALNGYALIRRMTDRDVDAGTFDPASMLAQYVDQMDLPEGQRAVLVRERLFIPPELAAMTYHSGFDVEHVWGGTAGDWGKRPLKLDEIEVMLVARKRRG